MERVVELPNHKEYSQRKRNQKFGGRRNVHKADSNGHSVKRQVYDAVHDKYVITKWIRTGNGVSIAGNRHCDGSNDALSYVGATPFEQELGINNLQFGQSISISHKNLFNKIQSITHTNCINNNNKNNAENNEINKNEISSTLLGKEDRKTEEKDNNYMEIIKYDEKYQVGHGRESPFSREYPCERTCIAYYNIDELRNEYQKSLRKYDQYNKKCGLSNFEKNMNHLYIKDSNYLSLNKLNNKHSKYKSWIDSQNKLPDWMMQNNNNNKKNNYNNSGDFQYLLNNNYTKSGIIYSYHSIGKGLRVSRARIDCYGKDSYWAPRQFNDSRDYFEIDLGWNKIINAVSTRGRPLERLKENDYEPTIGQPIEYVKKYKLFVKKDEKNTVFDKDIDDQQMDLNKEEFEKENKRKKSVKNQKNFEKYGWECLGVFEGNKDAETQVFHRIGNNSNSNNNVTGKGGIIARKLRFYPLDLKEGGFHGRKSMRIGIYGCPLKRKNDKNKNENENGMNEDNKEGNDNGNDKNGNSSMLNASIPAVLISINEPSQRKNNYHSKNGLSNKAYDGVCSCSCYMCKSHKYDGKHERRSQRQRFQSKLNKIQNVNQLDDKLGNDECYYYTKN